MAMWRRSNLSSVFKGMRNRVADCVLEWRNMVALCLFKLQTCGICTFPTVAYSVVLILAFILIRKTKFLTNHVMYLSYVVHGVTLKLRFVIASSRAVFLSSQTAFMDFFCTISSELIDFCF